MGSIRLLEDDAVAADQVDRPIIAAQRRFDEARAAPPALCHAGLESDSRSATHYECDLIGRAKKIQVRTLSGWQVDFPARWR